MHLREDEVDGLVDILRECRYMLTNADLLDADIEEAIRSALDTLGVADAEAN